MESTQKLSNHACIGVCHGVPAVPRDEPLKTSAREAM